jgi:DnaJ-class molecular chaperone
MQAEECRMCGGDGRVGNAFGGSTARCPSCHGTGRRAEATFGFHDVTKTKPSHYKAPAQVATGPKVPVTAQGAQLATEVNATLLSAEAKTRLIAEIVNHESSHGLCTKTFLKKMRKQLRPGG